jgi:hypothetical protein
MTAPVTERASATTRSRTTTTIPAQRDAVATRAAGRAAANRAAALTEPKSGRRTAQQKAYARRDDRLRRIVGAGSARAAPSAGRPQFVLLIMVLLAVGLVATLWLSTAAAADSYRLKDATAEAGALSEQAERLHREVAVLASAPELARRAAELGMTPAQDPARLVVAPDGTVSVVGEPRAAIAPPPPVQPAPDGPPAAGGETQPSAPVEGAAPDGAIPDGTSDGTSDGTAADTDGARLAAPDGAGGSPVVDGGGGPARGAGDDASGPDAAGADADADERQSDQRASEDAGDATDVDVTAGGRTGDTQGDVAGEAAGAAGTGGGTDAG